MLGLLFLFFIGKYYYQLAESFKKNKWVFAVLGIATYYAGTFLAGILLGLILLVIGKESLIDNNSEFFLGIILLPFGILATYLLYKGLERNWKKEDKIMANHIDEIGKSENR